MKINYNLMYKMATYLMTLLLFILYYTGKGLDKSVTRDKDIYH